MPLDSAISYEELSEKCGVSKPTLQRLLRHAMTSRLFAEENGQVSHSPSSRLLLEDVRLAAFVDLHTEAAWKSNAHFLDAFERWPDSRDPRQVGYSIATNRPGSASMYEDIQRDPVRATNFARAMELFSSGEGYGAESLIEGFSWGDIGNGTVVDVSAALATLINVVVIFKRTGRWRQWVRKRSDCASLPLIAFHRSGHRNQRQAEVRVPRSQLGMDGI